MDSNNTVESLNARVNALKDELQAQLEEFLPAFERVENVIRNLYKEDISELRSFLHPPDAVQNTMKMVLILLGYKSDYISDWKNVKKLFSQGDFLQQILDFNIYGNVKPKVVHKVMKYINDPSFSSLQVMSASKAASILNQWVHAVIECDRINILLQPKRKALEELEKQLTVASTRHSFGIQVVESQESPKEKPEKNRSSPQSESDLRQLSQLALNSVKNGNDALLSKLCTGIQPIASESGSHPKYFAWKGKDAFASDSKTENQEKFPSASALTSGTWVKSETGGWILEEVIKIPVAGVKVKRSGKLTFDWSTARDPARGSPDNAKPLLNKPFALAADCSNDWMTEYNVRCLESTSPNVKDTSRVAGIKYYKKDGQQETVSSSISGLGSNTCNGVSDTAVCLEDELMVGNAPLMVQTETRENFGWKQVESVEEIKKKNFKVKYSAPSFQFGSQKDLFSTPASELAAIKFANFISSDLKGSQAGSKAEEAEDHLDEVEAMHAQATAKDAARTFREAKEVQRRKQKDFDEIMPALENALIMMSCVDRQAIEELRSFHAPPEAVCKLASAIMILLAGIHPALTLDKNGKVKNLQWSTFQKLLLDENKFLNCLKEIKGSIDEGTKQTKLNMTGVRNYILDPSFNDEVMQGISRAAANLCKFVLYIVKYNDLSTILLQRNSALAEANENLDFANAQLNESNEIMSALDTKNKNKRAVLDQSLVEPVIPDDWIVINKPSNAEFSRKADSTIHDFGASTQDTLAYKSGKRQFPNKHMSRSSEAAVEEEGTPPAASTPILAGRRQFPEKQKPQGSSEVVGHHDAESSAPAAIATPIKFGRKQFPDKKSNDHAPIFDSVQSATAGRPISETKQSFYSSPSLEVGLGLRVDSGSKTATAKAQVSSPYAPSSICDEWVIIEDTPEEISSIAKLQVHSHNDMESIDAKKMQKNTSNWAKSSRRLVIPASLAASSSSVATTSKSKSTLPRKSALPLRRKSSLTISQKMNRNASNPLFLHKRFNNPSDKQLKMYTSEAQRKFVWNIKTV